MDRSVYIKYNDGYEIVFYEGKKIIYLIFTEEISNNQVIINWIKHGIRPD